MSSNFFPMLSSSPPPIDDDDDSAENDDDDFGMYASAHNAFDSGLDSPVSNKSLKSKSAISDCENVKDISSANAKAVISNLQSNSEDYNGEINDTNADRINRINCVNSENSKKSKNDHLIENSSEVSCVRNDFQSGFISRSDDLPHFKPEDEVDGFDEKPANFPSSVDNSSQDFVPFASSFNEVESERFSEQESNNLQPISNDTFPNTCQNDVPELGKDVWEKADKSDAASFEKFDEKKLNFDASEDGCSSPKICDRFIEEIDLPSVQDSPLNGCDSPLGLERENHQGLFLDGDTASLASKELPDLNLPPCSVHDEDDDFEDFQDANFALSSSVSVVHNQLPSESEKTSKQCNESEDKSFGDFESVEPGIIPQASTEVTSPDEFADFESCVNDFAVPETGDQESEGDDFANFEAAEFSEPIKDSGKFRSSGENKVSKVVNAVFPLVNETPVEVEEDCTVNGKIDLLDQNSRSRRLWEKLHDNDQTPGLPFQWAVSHSFQQLLRSINVDYHSILRTSTVPFFASGLGLLEPVKGTAMSSDPKKTDDNNLNLQNCPIPPVHFDWGSSGLVNPLDCVQTASTLMDLSFLCSSSSTNSSSKSKRKGKDFSLENELLKPLPETFSAESHLKPQILEQLLSSSSSSITEAPQPSCRPPNLSQEAVHVLDQLPDISFIKAKVLMFPVAGT